MIRFPVVAVMMASLCSAGTQAEAASAFGDQKKPSKCIGLHCYVTDNPPVDYPPLKNPPLKNPPTEATKGILDNPPLKHPPSEAKGILANPPLKHPPKEAKGILDNPPLKNPPTDAKGALANPPVKFPPLKNPPKDAKGSLENPPLKFPPLKFPPLGAPAPAPAKAFVQAENHFVLPKFAQPTHSAWMHAAAWAEKELEKSGQKTVASLLSESGSISLDAEQGMSIKIMNELDVAERKVGEVLRRHPLELMKEENLLHQASQAALRAGRRARTRP